MAMAMVADLLLFYLKGIWILLVLNTASLWGPVDYDCWVRVWMWMWSTWIFPQTSSTDPNALGTVSPGYLRGGVAWTGLALLRPCSPVLPVIQHTYNTSMSVEAIDFSHFYLTGLGCGSQLNSPVQFSFCKLKKKIVYWVLELPMLSLKFLWVSR